MAVGDGYLHNKLGYLSIRHCKQQRDYLLWKKKLLQPQIKTTECYHIDNDGSDAYEFRTYTHKFIKLYRKVLYKSKGKHLSRKILNTLTPLGISIWYMDNGGLSQKKRNGKIYANELILNTHLDREDNQIIIDYFKEVWDIQFTQVKNRGLYRLRCGTKEARKFIKIVEPYVSQVESMSHKIQVIRNNLDIENTSNIDVSK